MSVGIFYWFVTIFRNMALLVQTFWEEKKLSKSVSGYFKTTKKNTTPIKAVMALPLRKEFFCGFSNLKRCFSVPVTSFLYFLHFSQIFLVELHSPWWCSRGSPGGWIKIFYKTCIQIPYKSGIYELFHSLYIKIIFIYLRI